MPRITRLLESTVRDKIEQKIQEAVSNKNEIKRIAETLSGIDSSESFMLGIVVGRLYNAFYYQTRRILGRDPTGGEFSEFLKMLKDAELDLR